MSGDGDGKEFQGSDSKISVSWATPPEANEKWQLPPEQSEPAIDISTLDKHDRQTSADKLAEVRQQLVKIREQYKYESSLPLIDNRSEGWKEYQAQYLHSYLLALELLNERVLNPKGQKSLTYEQAEKMEEFKISSHFKDKETGQEWELVLDKKPKTGWRPDDLDRGGTRISIWDYNKRGNRVTREWQDQDYEQWRHSGQTLEDTKRAYGDVYDVGWRIAPDGLFKFDSRRNSKSRFFKFFRENSQSYSMDEVSDVRAVKQANALLERTLEHPEKVKSSHHSLKLPKISAKNI